MFLIMNFLYLTFLVGVRPMKDRRANNVEIFNESMILIMNYHLFLFHFFEDDP